MELANFDLSEEMTTRLLSDYEKELKGGVKSDVTGINTDDTVLENPVTSKSAMKTTKNQGKSTNVQSKGKNNKNVKLQPQQKSTQQQPIKGTEKAKKATSVLKEDHFKKESESSTSDESWEKEFEL